MRREALAIRAATEADRPWLRAFMRTAWGSERMVDRDRVFYPAEHSALFAERAGQIMGVLTYQLHADECEITMIRSVPAGQGAGSALLAQVLREARAHNCRRVWLITTNDNLNALKFYQKRGFRLAALYPGAVDAARALKPEIPLTGEEGIPLRDEFELEIRLEAP